MQVVVDGPVPANLRTLIDILQNTRQLTVEIIRHEGHRIAAEDVMVTQTDNLLAQLTILASLLGASGHAPEAEALLESYELGITSTDFGGLGLQESCSQISDRDVSELLFLVSAHFEALNSKERAKVPTPSLRHRPLGRRGMTLSEKILAAHDVDRRGEVKPGDMIRVDVDWIMASELSWKGMERWYDRLGKPGIYRNDRFWLAGDHLVDPRILDKPQIKPFVEAAERARFNFKMTESQGMNYTIMHTEFCRERVQPGQLVIGSDSHTCSGGSVSALAIGLGVADVLLPLVTGETWFKVPETVEIRFLNKPKPGISGKDIILYILKELKRNTVAAERIVEYTGPGLQYLSRDARFAIANMTTEFGGVTGVFVPDFVTKAFVDKRQKPKYRSGAVYYRPDEDAQYVETYYIDLTKVESFVARYPKPDDVVPVTEVEGMELQGCFIGACTTAEEDLILAAMVLEEGMKRGARPVNTGGIREVVPGSLPILSKLREAGLAAVYEAAGWEIGVPSCSYCVGGSADKAAPGTTWLSSQNRNFENRMGRGSFGHLASAVTVAASSFTMKVTNPAPLLDAIDMDKVHRILAIRPQKILLAEPEYVEPGMKQTADDPSYKQPEIPTEAFFEDEIQKQTNPDIETTASLEQSSAIIAGRTFLLGDFIDTDALAPAEIMAQPNITLEGLGSFCLKHTHPHFRQCVKDGQNIVVAGEAFGCGSSREMQCLLCKGLESKLRDEKFWSQISDDRAIRVDLDGPMVELYTERGIWEKFPFQLTTMQRRLLECGGVEQAFHRYGKGLWEALTARSLGSKSLRADDISSLPSLEIDHEKSKVEW